MKRSNSTTVATLPYRSIYFHEMMRPGQTYPHVHGRNIFLTEEQRVGRGLCDARKLRLVEMERWGAYSNA